MLILRRQIVGARRRRPPPHAKNGPIEALATLKTWQQRVWLAHGLISTFRSGPNSSKWRGQAESPEMAQLPCLPPRDSDLLRKRCKSPFRRKPASRPHAL